MTRQEAIRLALDILRPLADAERIYNDFKADEGFTDEQYEAMLTTLEADDPPHPKADADPNLQLFPDGKVLDLINNQTLHGCECDNTHQQNDTVCRWCWAHGRRHWDDPEVGDNQQTQ